MITPHPDGALLQVRVSAGAARERLIGRHGDALKLSVCAAPTKGKANDAVCRLVAAALDLPASAVTVLRGATARDKTLLVAGVEPTALAQRLNRILVR